MLDVEMGDVIALLELLAPYLIAAGVAIVIGIIAMIVVRKRPKAQRTLIRGGSGIFMALAVLIVANLVAFGPLSTIIGLAAGGGKMTDATTEEALRVAEQVAAEGIVLLENDGLLPLADEQVNLFGWASANPVYGGAGSGGINDLYPVSSIVDGMESSGFAVNSDLIDFYNEYSSDRPEMSIQRQSWTLPEPPADTYPDELIEDAKNFSDTAVVVVSRMAGEGHSDMPLDVSAVAYDDNSTEYADFEPGEHYLQLSQTEADMIDLVTSNFDNVVFVYNSANPMELGFIDDYSQIRSVVWSPGPGNVGFDALGKILAGDVNPSGKAADTFIRDMTAAPWWNNQAKRAYENMTHLEVEGMNAGSPEMFTPSFINYVDGIYVGYKYYETAADEGLIDYDDTVQYSFGHGLSYTTFEQQMSPITESDGILSIDVSVTNTGDVGGKDVVEVYYNPPYVNGGIEKATTNLVAFEKTEILEPGASQTVTLSFSTEDMASYDMAGEGAYVLEAGDYTISINRDAHEVIAEEIYTVDSSITYSGTDARSSDKSTAANLFEDAAGDVTYLSRADGFANFDAAVAAPASLVLEEPFASEYRLNSNFDVRTYLDDSDTMPTTDAENGMLLAELRGADYDDPRWETLLDQLSVKDMAHLTSLAGYQTAAIDSVGKLGTVDSDGPASINNNFTGQGSVGFPVAIVIASTWNKTLAFDYGVIMGKMSRELNSAGWYAPAMNTHRIPFGARNYEYFSEDGVLAGEMAAGAVAGAADEGVYAYIKHFALYDSNGKMVSIWANEQSMREIYLKPFEISVKEGGANAVMVSWNFIGNKWAGERSELMNTVLRDEWGFRGMVLTDFFRNNGHGFMNADMALANGVDAMLSTFEGGPNNVQDPSAATTVQQLRTASKNIMYPVVNSWVYDAELSKPIAQPWQQTALIINIIVVAGLAGVGFLVYKRSRKAADKA